MGRLGVIASRESVKVGIESILTTKGDILHHDGSGVVRLPVGTDDQMMRVLTDILGYEPTIDEEGDFTPGIADNSLDGSGESQTYSVQVGRYALIGEWCFFNLRFLITSLGTLTTANQVRVVGLPFTSNSLSNSQAAVYVGRATSLALPTADQSVSGDIVLNSTNIELYIWDATGGQTTFLLSELSAGAGVILGGMYRVN